MSDDEPITLAEACKLFPRARLTVSTLKREAARGRLDIFMLGRGYCTTKAAMQGMVEKCRDDGRRRDCTSTEVANNGASSTEAVSSALQRAQASVNSLKLSSRATSSRNTNQHQAPRP